MKYFINRTNKQLERDWWIYGKAYYRIRHKFNILRFILGNRKRISPQEVHSPKTKGE